MTFKKTLLSTALVAAMGVSASASAMIITADWSGTFTMVGSTGLFTANTDTGQCTDASCARTAITGTMQFDTVTGAGSATVVPFSFFVSGLAIASSITMQAIGNGAGGAGPLVLGNMGFTWNGSVGIPVSLVLDATGFFNAVGAGVSISQTITGGTLGATDNTKDSTGVTHPMGPQVMSTQTQNTTAIGTIVLGSNPSGTLPLLTDNKVDASNGDIGIGGSPMRAGPFLGFNANFDVASVHVTSVPVPAAAWLFGSGLVGLVGVARRKRSA